MDDVETRLRQLVATMPNRDGGRLCLDFANTVEPRGGPTPYTPPPDTTKSRREHLPDYAHLVAWGVDTGVLTERQAARLLDEAVRRPEDAQAVHARAIALREAVYRLFWTNAHGETPLVGDLAAVQREYLAALSRAALSPAGMRYDWMWPEETDALDGVLRSVARSAVELLTGSELDRVKVCPGAGGPIPCMWLFYDESKNRSRHWCNMRPQGCGAVVKARHQTARRRAARTNHAR